MKKTILDHLYQDRLLKTAIEAVDLPESAPSSDVYGSLLRSIVSQQLSVKAAATIYGRFLDLFDQNPAPSILLDTDVETLRSVGLSKQKSGYMHNIARFFQENSLKNTAWETMSDEAIIQLLTQIKGVGVWTVQMILMFTLQREDVLPTADLGIQQAMQQLYNIEGKGKVLIKQMETIAEPWKPYRSIACRYLWKWKDTV